MLENTIVDKIKEDISRIQNRFLFGVYHIFKNKN